MTVLKDGRSSCTILLEDETVMNLKILAVIEDTSVSCLIEKLVLDYLDVKPGLKLKGERK